MKHPQLSLIPQSVPFGGQENPIIHHVQELQCKLNSLDTYYLVVNVKCCPLFFLGGQVSMYFVNVCNCCLLLKRHLHFYFKVENTENVYKDCKWVLGQTPWL